MKKHKEIGVHEISELYVTWSRSLKLGLKGFIEIKPFKMKKKKKKNFKHHFQDKLKVEQYTGTSE